MIKTLPRFVWMFIFILNACVPRETAVPTSLPATKPAVPAASQTPVAVVPTEEEQTTPLKQYSNSAFGLSFQYSSSWFGPDEYVSDSTLRVSVGSDIVYPYGTDRTEQIYTVKNAYYVVLQYSKNDQNSYWKDTYQSLLNLKDGETLSGSRSHIIRVRQLDLGRLKGIEYISTLSETAQTEPVYSREVILVDEQSNLLTISGSPNNVEIASGAEWREVYRMIDEENLAFFHQIIESLKIE